MEANSQHENAVKGTGENDKPLDNIAGTSETPRHPVCKRRLTVKRISELPVELHHQIFDAMLNQRISGDTLCAEGFKNLCEAIPSFKNEVRDWVREKAQALTTASKRLVQKVETEFTVPEKAKVNSSDIWKSNEPYLSRCGGAYKIEAHDQGHTKETVRALWAKGRLIIQLNLIKLKLEYLCEVSQALVKSTHSKERDEEAVQQAS